MNLKELQENISKDTNLRESEIGLSTIDVPRRVAKYINMRADEKILLSLLQIKYDGLYKDMWLYYMGKAPKEVYKEKPFSLTVLKADVGIYLHADKELVSLRGKLELQKEKVKMIEDAIKVIKNMNFSIKNFIDYKKFLNGGY